MTGRLYGVGVGPGDPELVTLKAARLIRDADVVAYHSGHRRPLDRADHRRRPDQPGRDEELLIYPVTTGATDHPLGYYGAIEDFYDESAERLGKHLDAGRTVVVLAEGDPLFYSSYSYLHDRLAPLYPAEIVPGVTSVSAASAALSPAHLPGTRTPSPCCPARWPSPSSRGGWPRAAGGDHEARPHLRRGPRGAARRPAGWTGPGTSSGPAPDASAGCRSARSTPTRCPTSRWSWCPGRTCGPTPPSGR